jgi:FKBP-type peptidyl-prolyl cis-trans isomerase
MNIRLGIFSMVAILLSACGNNVTGQKEHDITLSNAIDSVSYGIGTQVGPDLQRNLKASGLDSLNKEAMFAGMRDAMDSVERIPADTLRAIVQDFMKGAHERMMAKQQAENEANLAKGKAFMAENGKKPGVVTTASGLEYEIVTMGKGAKPSDNDTVRVNYKGTLTDGKQFESTYDNGRPAEIPLDIVVPGWKEALELMPVGSHWKIYIPSELGWGERGAGADIPPNSVVIFDLELLDIVNRK